MLGTILFVYCLLFINTFYLSNLDVSRNKNLLNSQNNNTTISLSKELNEYTISRKPIGNCFYLSSILRDCTSVTCRQEEPSKICGKKFSYNSCYSLEFHNTQEINPYFVTGFTDAEGSFMIRIKKSSGYRLG
jgi:hypothetical protein